MRSRQESAHPTPTQLPVCYSSVILHSYSNYNLDVVDQPALRQDSQLLGLKPTWTNVVKAVPLERISKSSCRYTTNAFGPKLQAPFPNQAEPRGGGVTLCFSSGNLVQLRNSALGLTFS